MRASGWSSAVVAIALVACGGPRPPSRVIRFEAVSHSARLANGVRVLVVEDHATNLVQLGIRVAVGSSSDPAGKAGLAHLVEHLMFQVPGPTGRQTVGAELSAVAVGFNAHTTWDATQYVTVARADQLARLVELEARRFAARCEAISQGTFEREREVVRNERRLHRGLIGEDIERLTALIYPGGHPYTRSVGGNDLEISGLTQADACRFIAAHYRPERIVIVLSGDVDAGSSIRLIARHLGKVRRPDPAPPPAPIRPYPNMVAARRTIRGNLIFGTGAAVVVAWPMPPSYGREHAALSVATSLLQAELGRQDGPGGIVMELGDTRAPVAVAMIPLGGASKPGDAAVKQTLVAVDEASERARMERSPRVLEPLVNRRARELLADFDNLSTRVERLAEAFQVGGREQVFVHELQSLLRLRPDDVSRAARRLFDRRRAVVVVVEPGETASREPQGSGLSYAGKSHDDAWTAPVDAREAARVLDLPLPRSILGQAKRWRLDNGLEVILLRTPGVPLLSARLVFAGGSADDPPGREGLAFLAAHALDFRQLRRSESSYVAAYRALAWVGGDLAVAVEADRTMFSVSGLSSHLDVVLAGLASLVEDGQYSRELLERFRQARADRGMDASSPAAGRAQRWLELHAQLRRSLYRSVFGKSHPYARAANRWLRRRSRVSLADLEALRQRRFGARNGVLIVTGHFDPDLVRDHIEHCFSGLRLGAPHLPARPPPAARTSRVVATVTSDPRDTTALIEIAYPTVKNPARRAARMVVAHILRERMARVREVLGAAYSISARHEDNVGPGMFLISATVDANRVDEALVTMMGELDQLRAGGSRQLAEAFVRARRDVLFRVLAEESGANSAGARIASLIERGGSLDGQTRLAEQVMNLTAADLEPVLASDLAAEQEYVGLLGPEKSIAAARSAAGL